ncbi:MAG TPA: proline dehydrogenase family protein [Steroidobacter sp.]
MIRRTWQSGMIALARSAGVKRFMHGSRAASSLASRYVAGASAEDGLNRARQLFETRNLRSSLFYLGEYVSTPELVATNVEQKHKIASLLGPSGLDVHVSVDPTQIGYMLDAAQAREHAFSIARTIATASGGREGVHVLMLDMEDQSVTDATIALHDALQEADLPVALTLQAYLKRTEADLQRQIARGSKVRLVKGAFAAGEAIAFTRQNDIKANSRRLIDLMLSKEARESGFYPIIATHDTKLHEHAINRARENGWRADQWEFEMLLGVRSDVAESLARAGHRTRLYVPFGQDWWPYAVRRIGENPRNAWLLARSILAPA